MKPKKMGEIEQLNLQIKVFQIINRLTLEVIYKA